MRIFLLIAGAVLVLPLSVLGEERPAANKVVRINPHNTKANCDVCHAAALDDLNSWFTLPSTKKKMKSDHNQICRQCHGVDFGHGVGKTTRLNREDLSMDENGKIACAITCHNMHITSSDANQERFHLRVPQQKLCKSCHNE